MGDSVYRQTIGVPIGIDSGPFIANLTLWYFENKFLEGTYKTKYIVTRKLRYTFRLIDDITTINSDGYFKEYVDNIYPACLELKGCAYFGTLYTKNLSSTSAGVLKYLFEIPVI